MTLNLPCEAAAYENCAAFINLSRITHQYREYRGGAKRSQRNGKIKG
jgi:hypothetical protein